MAWLGWLRGRFWPAGRLGAEYEEVFVGDDGQRSVVLAGAADLCEVRAARRRGQDVQVDLARACAGGAG